MKFNFNLVITTDTLIALAALVFSLFDLYLHMRKFDKERIHFHIQQDKNAPAYNFSFVIRRRYHMAFFRLIIENRSLSPATITRFELQCPDGQRIEPAAWNIKDLYNPNGLTLYERSNDNRGQFINLGSENLLDHMRFVPNDAASGYLVFFGVPALTSDAQEYVLHTYAGSKHYATKLIASKLPDDLKPKYE